MSDFALALVRLVGCTSWAGGNNPYGGNGTITNGAGTECSRRGVRGKGEGERGKKQGERTVFLKPMLYKDLDEKIG
uniref:Uncharacterized protein n=1 Tax=Nostoc flagelliforme str. Sunitezuoqi TaxID=676037 RepID=E7DQ46_9NOSO|nr:hypothetical protein Nfla_7301 [Nostoc flagelliforme str. Sunitezuoqi]